MATLRRNGRLGVARMWMAARRRRGATLCGLSLLALAVGYAAVVQHHANYDLTETDPTAVDRLYQALVDDVGDSLDFALKERFSEALAALGRYQQYVAQLSEFRSDLGSRGLDALILESKYSTEPFVPLGRNTHAVVDDQSALAASILLAREAAESNRTDDMRAAILAARIELERFASSIRRFNSSVHSIPGFLNGAQLSQCVGLLWELAARYAAEIAGIERGDAVSKGTIETRIEVMAAPLIVKTGEEVKFWGTLATADGVGLGNETIRINFLATPRTVRTTANGSFATKWLIGENTAPDAYPAQAVFEPSPPSNLSGCRSEVLNVTVRSPKMRSHLDVRTSSPRCRLGDELQLWGRLYTDWGVGLNRREIAIESPNLTGNFTAITDEDGAYRATIKPVAPGLLVLRSTFAGDEQYLGSNSPTLEVHVTPYLLATAVDLITPGRVVAGKIMRISGRVRDQNGDGLGLVWVSLEWDGVPLRSITTNPDGSFVLQPPTPRGARGNHTLEAVFESHDPRYLSSRSGKREVELSTTMPRVTAFAILASVIGLVFALAIARTRRLRKVPTRRMPVSLPGPPGPEPMPPGPRMAETAPSEAAGEAKPPLFVGRGRDALLLAYAQLVRSISHVLSLDLANMTHTEILSLLVERRVPDAIRAAASRLTRIYEKAAYSGLDLAQPEENEFRRHLEVLVASLKTIGGG